MQTAVTCLAQGNHTIYRTSFSLSLSSLTCNLSDHQPVTVIRLPSSIAWGLVGILTSTLHNTVIQRLAAQFNMGTKITQIL